jgi:hypothetical protein
VLVIGRAINDGSTSAHADCRGIARFGRILRRSVYFYQLRKINFRPKNLVNRVQISAVPIGGQLHAMRQTFLQIREEMIRASRVTLADKPTRHEFGVGGEGNPCPNIARAFGFHLSGAILFLCANEAPNFVTLNAALEIAKNFVLIIRAGTAKIAQKFINSVARNVCHTCNGAHGITFDQSGKDACPLISTQFVHVHRMLERSSIVNRKVRNFAGGKQLRRREDWCSTCSEERSELPGGVGFEPTRRYERLAVYKTAPIGHYGNPPINLLLVGERAGDLIHHRLFTFIRSMRCLLSPSDANSREKSCLCHRAWDSPIPSTVICETVLCAAQI